MACRRDRHTVAPLTAVLEGALPVRHRDTPSPRHGRAPLRFYEASTRLGERQSRDETMCTWRPSATKPVLLSELAPLGHGRAFFGPLAAFSGVLPSVWRGSVATSTLDRVRGTPPYGPTAILTIDRAHLMPYRRHDASERTQVFEGKVDRLTERATRGSRDERHDPARRGTTPTRSPLDGIM